MKKKNMQTKQFQKFVFITNWLSKLLLMEPISKEIWDTIYGVTKLERKCNEIFDRQKQY